MRSQSPMYDRERGRSEEESISARNSHHHHHEDHRMFGNKGVSHNDTGRIQHDRRISQSPMRRHISQNPSFEQAQSYQSQMDSGESSMYDSRERFESNASQNNTGVNRERSQSPMLRHFTQSPSSHQYSQPSNNQARPIMRSQSPMYDRERRRTEEASPMRQNMQNDPYRYGRGMSPNTRGSRVQSDISRGRTQSPLRRQHDTSHDHHYQSQPTKNISQPFVNSRERSQSPTMQHYSSHQNSAPSHHQQYSQQNSRQMHSRSPMFGRHNDESPAPTHHNSHIHTYNNTNTASTNTKSHSHPYSGSSNYNTHQSQTMGPPSVERGRSQSPSPYNTRSHERPPTNQSHAPSNVFPNNGNSKQSGYTAMTSSQIMKRNERIRRHRNSIQRSSSITRSSSNPAANNNKSIGVEDSTSYQQQQRQVQSTPNTNTNNSSDIQYRRRVRDMLRRDHGHNHNAPAAHHSKQQQVEQQSRTRNRGHSQPRYNDTTSSRMMMRQHSSNNNNSGRGVVGWPSGSGHQPGVRNSSRRRMDYDLEVD